MDRDACIANNVLVNLRNKNQAIIWHDATQGATFDIVDIPADMVDDVKAYRSILIEAVADYDENLLDKYMEDPDSITEEEITQTIRNISSQQNQITVLIAHRLSTIMQADKIVVLDQGRIVDVGTHDQLITRGGLYKRLYEKETSAIEPDSTN